MPYIQVGEKEIPVFFIHEDRNWAWKRKNWIGDLSIIKDKTFEIAINIEEKCNELDFLAVFTYLKQFIIDDYSKDMQYSWAIEGEYLDSYKVRSSIIKQLCLDIPEWIPNKELVRDERENRAVQSALSLINSSKEISIDELIRTHKLLATGIEDDDYGKIRTSPEIVGKFSSDRTRYEVIFEAPDPENVYDLLEQYITWWKNSSDLPAPLGAALAQLYFVEIHPFHDGNGRMGRLLTDKYLVRIPEQSFRPYSMSAVVRTHRSDDELTLSKDSAITGGSFPKLDNVNIDGIEISNLSREPLVPFICTSRNILEKPYGYYRNLDLYSSKYEIDDYLRYMLFLQESAIEGAKKRIPLLHELYDFFQETKAYLNNNERSIIKNSYLADSKFVQFEDATPDILDANEAEAAWEILREAELLDEYGKPRFDVQAAKRAYELKK